MIWSTPAIKDTTIYEFDPYRNTGLDQVLELRKKGDSSTNDLSESRILIKFDLSNLNQILVKNGVNINNVTASIRLYQLQESELPTVYTIEARPLAADWDNGSGYVAVPDAVLPANSIVDGATWMSAKRTPITSWSSSLATGSAMLYNISSSVGGGVWYTSSLASQSFSFKSDDSININVSRIVEDWYTGSYNNNGFIISFKNNELTSSNYPITNIQLYSAETHTVYEPQLYVSWATDVVYNTGSMSVINSSTMPIVYARAFKSEYLKDKKVRIMLGARDRYPRASFAQNSTFATMKAMPVESYYQIKDAHNNNIIIPYSSCTKISSNADGAYFDVYTTMMQPERYYTFEIKTEFADGTEEYFSSNEFTFKITL